MRTEKMVVYLIATSASLFALVTTCLAQADLMVYPSRILLSDRERTAQVDIINNSQTQGIYKISLVRKRMTETGAFSDISNPDPEERFADDLVKYSPRQVTLLPGASQTVRMMVKIPKDLPEG